MVRLHRALGGAARAALTAQVSTVEAAGLVHGIASIGPSFDRSLLPRTTFTQAGVTGVWSALNYGLTATTQSLVEAAAARMGADSLHSPHARRAAILSADAALLSAGLGMHALARTKGPEQSMRRAGVEALGWRLAVSGIAGSVAVAADGLVDAIRREHDEQTVSAPAVLLAGAATSAAIYLLRHRRLIDRGVDTDQFGRDVAESVHLQPPRAVAVGLAVSSSLYAASRVESALATLVSRPLARALPGAAPYARPLGHALVLGAAALGVERGLGWVKGQTEQAGQAVEPAYRDIPDSPFVSGGTRSLVDWETFGREGRRFVNMAMSAEEISAVTGEPAGNPVRAFIGLTSAVSPISRAFLAMQELEQLGGLDRGTIAVFAPTGTGYVNYVAAETLELLTGGDVASVSIQYSVRPSFLSLGEVGTAWESYLAFLTALSWRIRALPAERRPKVRLIGESLGSLAAQDVFAKEGTQGFDLLGIDSALFIGSPYASRWRHDWLAHPERIDPTGRVVEVQNHREWLALPEEVRSRADIFLLTHNTDPIPKFGAGLLIKRPAWLGAPESRPTGVPKEWSFHPLLTFLQTGIDLLNATHVVPGRFESYGHDYRADTAEMVRVACALPADPDLMERVERALRERELLWAERRLVSETAVKAERQARATLESWGVDSAVVPSLVEPLRDVAPDPYAARQPGPAPAPASVPAGRS